MSVQLNTIRYYTNNDPYHYTVDNRPLSDLELNDLALKAAIDQLNLDNFSYTVAGDWSNLQVSIDLNASRGKAISYKFKLWAIEDQSSTSSQNATMYEEIFMGYNLITGGVVIQNSTSIANHKVGAKTLVTTMTGSGDSLIITFSGYTGINGLVKLRAEKYGL